VGRALIARGSRVGRSCDDDGNQTNERMRDYEKSLGSCQQAMAGRSRRKQRTKARRKAGSRGRRLLGRALFHHVSGAGRSYGDDSGRSLRGCEKQLDLPTGNTRTHRAKTPWANERSAKREEAGETARGAGPGCP
jgi:hypothetical protein